MRNVLIICLLLQISYCFGQKNSKEQKELYDEEATSLTRALKHPDKTKRVSVLMYSDSIFPNDDILKLRNVEHIILSGRNELRQKKTDTPIAPIKLRIDTNKLKQLQKLKYLSFIYFDFRKFPVELCSVRQLVGLTMCICLIDSLPEEIGNLTNLKVLMIRINNVKELPKGIVKLDSLEVIDLCNNRFRKIPKELSEIKNLRKIYLTNAEGRADSVMYWKWPYPLYNNTSSYDNSEILTVKKILDNKQLEKIYLPFVGVTSEETDNLELKLKSVLNREEFKKTNLYIKLL